MGIIKLRSVISGFWLLVILFGFSSLAGSATETQVTAFSNQACLRCHDGGRVIEVVDTSPASEVGDKRHLTAIVPDGYGRAVHGRMACVDCHAGIVNLEPPHRTGVVEKLGCANCHESLAKSSGLEFDQSLSPGLAAVRKNSADYKNSYHARPNKDYPEIPNATCHECHDSHFFNVPKNKESSAYADWRLTIPELCKKCHEDQALAMSLSVHGVEGGGKERSRIVTCVDCHTAHEITGSHLRQFRLQGPDTCGRCHRENLGTYRNFFHGQSTQLGYVASAKCPDCHESHKVLAVKDPKSTVHPNNRMQTCQKCHDGQNRPLATKGFSSFNPHANSEDYVRYPELWLASRFMTVLFWGVFSFFSVHSGLWLYRELQEGRKYSRDLSLDYSTHGIDQGHFILRFSFHQRTMHLILVLVVMVLMGTGMAVRHAGSGWAAVLSKWCGGFEMMGGIHRVGALVLVGLVLGHLVFTWRRLRRVRAFSWFGPDSLLPNKKDWTDCRDMFKWFFGRGEKPIFDRWTYYEKFDYWAVFWGVIVMATSGMILTWPHHVGRYVGGWIFNVALLVHGEEAFLAAVFLFTVHFFNNHFRPGKWPPPDLVMFTGTQSFGECHRDHPGQMRRLLERGELGSLLVPPPSPTMVWSSKYSGLFLLVVGLVLLFLVLNGA